MKINVELKCGIKTTLPIREELITSYIEEMNIEDDDSLEVVDFDSEDYDFSNLDIIGYDVYYLNELLSDLSTVATNKEIIALLEVYSSDLLDIIERARRGTYKFYPNKNFKDLLYEPSIEEDYKYYDDEFYIYEDLLSRGYQETSVRCNPNTLKIN